MIRAVHASLRRLGTDWIDVLQVHGIDQRTDPEETLRALDDLVRAGTVRYLGCSNFSAWQLMKALGVSQREHLHRFSVLQAHYSLVSRELEHELVPVCLDQGVGIVVWSPLSGGFLTGKVRRDQDAPEGSRQSVMGPPGGLADPEGALDVVEALVEIADGPGREPRPGGAQLAAGEARGDVADRGRPHRGAARRQPGGRPTGRSTRPTSSGSTRCRRHGCRTPSGTSCATTPSV